ncbi:P-loop containing nucleoside triphosphate hydrolase protein [Ilyonectria robusta]|uniref:P-loop containing nucleoside triphosphate hydrolase protein n=1 Tax=Ilyonectria robusta TaxID=1079257 RepID=UPI001E8CCF25|nr:P-loop containing nucleoside triphosphate hydrolase protein [Ilyonectria robusta]KAH8677057.1 P-loop containing nucleoside triphosphate hydrolase protein [Ilyonectria robusta]
MAPPSSRRRRRSESQDDDDENRYGDPSHATDSPKRPRLDEAESEDETDDRGPPPTHTNGVASGSSSDGFQPGAIVRVSVQNFVTYEKAEFFPGPHLNMVVGPNGTGKSSLVCAICLGLGYSPKHLGRAGSVKEFVKHGKDTATIEIELYKRAKDRRNFVVKVQIRREQNSQKWWLNGKETNHKTIQSLMRKLKIQVDNLCQFLPQDRVVEFAACTPVDLLHETLRAAAPEEMLEWQRQLQDLHKDKKGLSEAVHTDSDTLKNLESRQQGLQADVDRIREREEILEQVKNLKSALVLSRYQEARDLHSSAKERKKIAERSLRRLEQESGPSLVAVNDKQEYARQIEAVIPRRRQALKDAEETAKKRARDVSVATGNIKEFDNKLEAERKDHEAKKKEVAQSRSRLTALQGDLKNRPEEFNPGEFNRNIRGEEHKMRELETEQREITNQCDAIKTKGRAITTEMKQVEADILSFDTQQGQQLNFMKKNFPEIAAGWEWVQENQDQFEKQVFGPPMISCSIKDERYSDQVQALLQVDDFTCFTAQTKSDYKKLTDQLYRVMSLSVVVRTCAHPLSAFRPPVEANEARELGLDGFAIDFLEGPDPILAMLCAEKRLHQSGVSLTDHNDIQYDRLVKGGKVNQWAAGRQSYSVRRRKEYGPQAMTTITKNIQTGRFWTSQPIDNQEKDDMNKKVTQLRAERDTLKEELREAQAKSKTIEDQKADTAEIIERLRREKNTLQKEYQKWQSLPEKIESEERAKTNHEQAMRDARKNMVDLRYEWDAAVLRRAELVLRLKDSVDRIRAAHHAVLDAEMRKIEATSDIQGLKDRNSHIMERLQAEKEAMQQATDEATRTREAGRVLSQAVQDILAEEPEKRDLLSSLCEGKNPEEMQLEIGGEEAKLELIHAANPNVVREFERRAGEIARLARKMEGSSEKLETLTREIDGLMAKWEPTLDELVAKISDAFAYNFEQISCAGEIRVHKAEDFDAWALDVMVRFRENETLQQLTAHRQSGGERAVSTIFYLMALQSMAQSPFRVVDEINQGMDPRNERMVHERMVEIACREHTSQYFLITPKLLTGLRYDPKMRILCIASGEHMPREGRKLDFKRCLRIQKGLMTAAA